MQTRNLPLFLLVLFACPLFFACPLLFSCKSSSDSLAQKEKEGTPDVAKKSKDITEKVAPAPKLHSGGMDRFREPGIYVDGKALGVLRFGELPISLKPFWYEEQAPLPFKAGDGKPKFKIVKQRRYRFNDYFKAMGLDLSTIKEMHIYGGNRRAAAVVIPGKNLQKFDDFLFRFGGAIWGKPLPSCPPGVGDGKCPDQIGAITLYIKNTPPTRDGGNFYFENDLIKGIPYNKNPIRGGIRVYFDGPLVATIKRNKLKSLALKTQGAEGEERYPLFQFLKTQGIQTDTIAEAWLIHYERHVKKLDRKELLSATFHAEKTVKGEVMVGQEETPTHVIHLYSKPLTKEDLPVLLAEEIEHADG